MGIVLMLLYVDVKKQLESLLNERRNVNLDLVHFFKHAARFAVHIISYKGSWIHFHMTHIRVTISALNPSELSVFLFRFVKSQIHVYLIEKSSYLTLKFLLLAEFNSR